MEIEWVSIRNRWPEFAGYYCVKDCRHGVEGTSFYDGYDWEKWEPLTRPMKGSLILIEYHTTHWKPLKELNGN